MGARQSHSRRASAAAPRGTRLASASVKLRCYARGLKLKVQFVCSFIALSVLLILSFYIIRNAVGGLTLMWNARNCFDAACNTRIVLRAAEGSNFEPAGISALLGGIAGNYVTR